MIDGSLRSVLGRAGGIVVSGLVFATAGLSAQDAQVVEGRVVDPEGRPVDRVAIGAGASFWRSRTGPDGRFRLRLDEGRWRLTFRRLGYRAETVAVSVPSSDRLTVVLRPRPVALRGLTADAEAESGGGARTLNPTVTTETVRQAPALGEPDVFRSLVYLPGVTQPNDLKGRLHVAGGSSDEAGYRLDGHPLQQPFHLLGLMGGFNVAALERADLLVHRYPVSEGGRLSGIVDLHSREPGPEPANEAVVSLLSSSFTTARPEVPGGLDLLASGRITYLDRVIHHVAEDAPRLGFHDALVRLGRSWGGGWRAEVLGFTTGNVFRGGDVKGVEDQREPLTWGESMAGVRLRESEGRWRFELRGSFDRASTMLDERPVGEDVIETSRDWWSADLVVRRRARRWRAAAGVEVDHRRHEQAWRASGLVDELLSPNVPGVFSGVDALTTTAAFGELGWSLTERLRLTAGGRLVRAAGEWNPAPRALVSYEASDALTLEAAAAKRLQFDAEIEEPVEWTVNPPRFLLEEPREVRQLSVAAQWEPPELPVTGTEGRIRLVGFVKDYPDRPVLEDRERLGRVEVAEPGFPSFRRVEGRAFGGSLGIRFRIGEEGLFQGSYTFQRSRERVEGEWAPTTWDTPHNLVLFTSLPLWGSWTVNAAFRAHSGRAATPAVGRVFAPDATFGEFLVPRFLFGDRNSLRLGGYRRLDLGVRHGFDALGAGWVLFGQVLNATATDNPIRVDWLQLVRGRQSGLGGGLQNGLPVIPSLGVEVTW